MPIKTIIAAEGILARFIPEDEWNIGSKFFSDDNEYLQVGTWNHPAGRVLGPHIHNEVKRTIDYTCEVIFIYSGRVLASIYDCREQIIEKLELKRGDTLILLKGGHGYEILEEDTRVLEIKNGPYRGPQIDRRVIGLGEQNNDS